MGGCCGKEAGSSHLHSQTGHTETAAGVNASAKHPFSVFVGTWNMGDAPPPEPDSTALFDRWLPRNQDIYAINVQECSYDTGSKSVTCEQHWHGRIEAYLGNGYKTVATSSLWGIFLIVLVRDSPTLKLDNVASGKEATGIGHVGGNKGGLVVAFRLNATSFCFVGSHLAAHQHKVKHRNNDFKEIIQGVDIGQKPYDITNQYHYMFWTGDLNYRLDLDRDECIRLINAGDWETLHRADQLIDQMRDGKVFAQFTEQRPMFPPTYKMDRGDVGDLDYTEEKLRVPSWCDRVLYHVLPGGSIQQTDYDWVPSVKTSDHRPVRASFKCAAREEPRPVLRADLPPYKVHLSYFRGRNLLPMDNNNKSDPYVVFHAPSLKESGVKTKTIMGTLSPDWTEEQLPDLELHQWTDASLRDSLIFVACRDYDKLSGDDDMGQGAISLHDALGPEPVPFTVHLLQDGFPAGNLHGYVHVTRGNRVPVRNPNLEDDESDRAPLYRPPSEGELRREDEDDDETEWSSEPGMGDRSYDLDAFTDDEDEHGRPRGGKSGDRGRGKSGDRGRDSRDGKSGDRGRGRDSRGRDSRGDRGRDSRGRDSGASDSGTHSNERDRSPRRGERRYDGQRKNSVEGFSSQSGDDGIGLSYSYSYSRDASFSASRSATPDAYSYSYSY